MTSLVLDSGVRESYGEYIIYVTLYSNHGYGTTSKGFVKIPLTISPMDSWDTAATRLHSTARAKKRLWRPEGGGEGEGPHRNGVPPEAVALAAGRFQDNAATTAGSAEEKGGLRKGWPARH